MPRSLFVHEDDPRRELREAVDAILSDAFMGLLALLLLPIIVLPFFVTLPPDLLALFEASDATIVAFFAAEYVAKLYLAEDRAGFARNPWHLLDLSVVLLSVVSYLPVLPTHGEGSLILLLRLLRLPRVFAVGGRALSVGATPAEAPALVPPAEPVARIRQVDPRRPFDPRDLSWQDLERHLSTHEAEWIDLSGISEASLVRLSSMLRLPDHHFRLRQLDELRPHATQVERNVFLFLQTGEIVYPERTHEFYTIARRGSVVVIRGPKVISISSHAFEPFAKVAEALDPPGDEREFASRVAAGLVAATLEEYRALLAEIDAEVSGIARIPRARLPKDFLPRVYELNKGIARVESNLAHLRELLGRMLSGRITVLGRAEAERETLERLADEASYLSELSKEAAENLGTSIDIYINQSSFDTNRILKILAVITAVAIIPSVIGGLLGIDGPYDFVFWQVIVVIALSMLFLGYCFVKLGWLRA